MPLDRFVYAGMMGAADDHEAINAASEKEIDLLQFGFRIIA
jgi:hypothetical protein